ncbi:MAG: leucine-rich repeat protein [Bacteroidaceae bacterium]|nr:leucine-rich repeat protein [Bacteroidaceae bacterium]
MKRIILSFMVLIIAFVGLSAQSQIFNVGGFYYRLMPDTYGGNESDLIAVVSTMGDMDYYKGEISIPSTISQGGVEYSVAAIGDLAFKGSKQLTSIRIPASIRQVPAGAFYGCDNLVSITVDSDNPVYDSRDNCNAVIETATNTLVAGCKNTVIPSSVPILGECAFYGTRGLTSLTVTESIKEIGNWTFLDCENIETLNWNSVYPPSLVTNYSKMFLRDVVLGDSVTYIESWAFSGCRNLKSIKYSSNIKGIGNYAFAYCESLTSMIIPHGVENMGYDAFIGCDGIETLYLNSNNAKRAALRSLGPSLKTLVLGDSVTSLDLWDFAQCDELESIVVEPGNPVFDSRSNCNAIIETATNKLLVGCKTTTIPEGVTCIESGAFSYCGGPKTISLPSSLLSIANHAFLGCDSLTSLVIPANVNQIGLGITNGCYSLTSLSVDSKNLFYDSRGDCNAIIEKSTGKLIAGSNRSTVPEGVTEIETNAFSDLHGLSSIIIPSGVKSIGSSAFSGCVGLKTITLPSSLDNIGSFAFQQCINLLSVKIPQGIKSIGTGLFYGCDTLTTVEIPSSVDSIGSRAFMYCRSLKSLIIPEGVTTIEDLAFAGCYSLSYLSMPSTVTKIDGDVFYGCESLKTTGPKGGGYNYEFSWDTIPANAFLGLNYLESAVIPKTVKAIYECDYVDAYREYNDKYPSAVFAGCYNLKSVSVSFKDTKLFRFCIRQLTGIELFEESPMDYNLYKMNPVRSITVLDDSIRTFSTFLTGLVENVILSENVIFIDSAAFGFSPYSIQVDRSNPRYDPLEIIICNNVSDITVDNGNRHFMSNDGVLFNINGNELLSYPAGRIGGYRIPKTTDAIAGSAFKFSRKLSSVYIPASVESIGERAFEGCDSLKEVIIEGSPEIGRYAFWDCKNIESVTTRNSLPGKMRMSDSPQTIMVGEYNDIVRDNSDMNIVTSYNNELGRTVAALSDKNGRTQWKISLSKKDIPAGKYKVSIGILPNLSVRRPVLFVPEIKAINKEGRTISLVEPYAEIDEPPFFIENSFSTSTYSEYERVVFADCIEIQSDFQLVKFIFNVGGYDPRLYSNSMILDRIFLEPLDDNLSAESFAGPFTENVFNDATLYVPEGAVETYRTADGWKYFKHIEVDTKTYPADEIEVSVNEAGYATFYYSDGAYTLPQGLSAMVVSGIADDKLVYETIAYGSESDIIPAGVPVILVSDNKKAGSFKLRLSDLSLEYMGGNLLYGSDTECLTYSYGNSYFYKLSYGPSGTDLSGVPGWYWGAPNGGAFNIEAHKAWLAVPARFGTKAAVGFSMSGDDVTEALSVKADGDDTEPVYYDLNGRNLYAPLGGTISITNGTKVIIIDK